MRYLVDTQIIVWAKEDNPKLSAIVRSILNDDNNEILVSQICLIELAIKLKLGKLPDFILSLEDFAQRLWDDGYTFFPIQNEHLFAYHEIPLHDDHRDPFDRMLIATAVKEKMTIISADEKFRHYEGTINIVW